MALRVVAIIPARGGSKGLPRKAIRSLGGKPLIEHTIASSLASKLIERTIVSTDDDEIASVARAAGAEVPFMRPAELATDTASMDLTIDHVLEELASRQGYIPDAYVILQPTNPFRSSAHIDHAITLMEERHVNSVVSVAEPTEHPAEMVTFGNGRMTSMLGDMDLGAGVQRQGYPDCYFLTGAIYLTRLSAYRDQSTRFAVPIAPYVMDPLDGFDIDTPRDFDLAEVIHEYRQRFGNSGWVGEL